MIGDRAAATQCLVVGVHCLGYTVHVVLHVLAHLVPWLLVVIEALGCHNSALRRADATDTGRATFRRHIKHFTVASNYR